DERRAAVRLPPGAVVRGGVAAAPRRGARPGLPRLARAAPVAAHRAEAADRPRARPVARGARGVGGGGPGSGRRRAEGQRAKGERPGGAGSGRPRCGAGGAHAMMNQLGLLLAGGAARATALAALGLALALGLRRRGPAAGALVALTTLSGLVA